MKVVFKRSKKQKEFLNAFESGKYREILYGGAAGGGKSYILWWLMVKYCYKYPGIRIGLGRHTLTEIKKNTLTTFYELIKNLQIPESEFKYNPIDGKITFFNDSVIQFFELRYLPSDPNYDRFGGALLTFGCIEEAGGVEQKGKSIFQSRVGRWRNDEFNIKPCLAMTCNPSMNFVYNDFYRPHQKGELEPFRKYISAKLTDNPFRPKHYEENLRNTLDPVSRARLLEGEWDFDGDKSRLLKYEEVLRMYENPEEVGDFYISADIAFTSDKCIIILWSGLTIKKIINFNGDDPADEIIRLKNEYNVDPRKIVYDSDGVGKYLKTKLRGAYAFVNNGQPINKENYDNLKSQVYFKLAEKIREGAVSVQDYTLRDELIQEVYEIKSQPLDTIDGKLKLVKKKEVVAAIGRSPDISDAMAYRMVFELKGVWRRPF